MSPFFHTLGDWIAHNPDAAVSSVGLLLAITTWALDHRLRRARLLYRVQMDTPLGLAPAIQQSVAEIVVRVGGAEVPDPSVVLVRINNTGSLPIRPEDFTRSLSFEFGGRTVVGYEVAEAENETLKRQLSAETDAPVVSPPPPPPC